MMTLIDPTEPHYDPNDPDNPLYHRRDWYRTGVVVKPEQLKATYERLHNRAEDGQIPYPSSIELREETAVHFTDQEEWVQRADCVVRQIHFNAIKVLYTVMLEADETTLDRVDSAYVDVQDDENTRYWADFAVGDSVEVELQGAVIEGIVHEVTFGADDQVWYSIMVPSEGDNLEGPWAHCLHDIHEDLIVDFPSRPDGEENGGFNLLDDLENE